MDLLRALFRSIGYSSGLVSGPAVAAATHRRKTPVQVCRMPRFELPCPHCGVRLPRISVWQSVPSKGRPNYHCAECGEDAWFPLGTRVFAMLSMVLVLAVVWTFTFALFEMETRHPATMVTVIFVLLGGGLLAAVWTAGRVCAGSSYLVRSNYESTRARRRASVRPRQ